MMICESCCWCGNFQKSEMKMNEPNKHMGTQIYFVSNWFMWSPTDIPKPILPKLLVDCPEVVRIRNRTQRQHIYEYNFE